MHGGNDWQSDLDAMNESQGHCLKWNNLLLAYYHLFSDSPQAPTIITSPCIRRSMSGVIHRYEVLEKSALLPGVGEFPEPDFWSLDVPIMAICEPGLRSELGVGDWVFHVPKKGETDNVDYQVTGMLKINEIVTAKHLIESQQFGEEWTRRFKIELADCGHLVDALLDGSDAQLRTAQRRVKNHLLGDPDDSAWYGASGESIQTIAQDIGVQLGSFGGPRVKTISDSDARVLAAEINFRLEEEPGTPPNAIH